MINNNNDGNGGPIQPGAMVQIPAKEFAAKYRSKRGQYYYR